MNEPYQLCDLINMITLEKFGLIQSRFVESNLLRGHQEQEEFLQGLVIKYCQFCRVDL